MRLRQRSPAVVAALGLMTCVCAFYATTAVDIPLEGECRLRLPYRPLSINK